MMRAHLPNGPLVAVPEAEWRQMGVPGLLGVWFGAGLEVLKLRAPKPALVRLAISRADRASGITWETLQQVKNECGYLDHEAVEIYPPHADAVVTANVRHLWILRERCAFSWRLSGPDAAPHFWGSE